MSGSSLKLPLSTSRTKTGPRLRGNARQAIVEYDFECDDGSIEWVAVTFDDVLDYEFRQAACCSDEDVGSVPEVRVLEASERLSRTIRQWQDAVGWQVWQQKQGGAERFKHFKMYFDDAGCVDVIAAACRLSDAPNG